MDLKKLLHTLQLAETELKSQYRKTRIKESNVLKAIAEAQEQVKSCGTSPVGGDELSVTLEDVKRATDINL